MGHFKIIIALASLMLAGCNAATLTCVPLHQYTAAEKRAALQQYRAAKARGDSEAMLRMIDDYGVERDAIRACIKRRDK